MSLALTIFGGASPLVKETDKTIGLMGVTPFVATQFGLTMDEVEKHRDTMPLVQNKKTGEMKKPSNMAACKELLISRKLATEDQIKALGKTYDTGRNAMYAGMRQQNALLASDPNVRVTLRATKNAKTGQVSRVHATYAPAGEGVSAKQRVKQLEAEVARLTKLAAKQTLVATTQVVDDMPL